MGLGVTTAPCGFNDERPAWQVSVYRADSAVSAAFCRLPALGRGAVGSIVRIASRDGPGVRSAAGLAAAPVGDAAQRLSARRILAGEIGGEWGSPPPMVTPKGARGEQTGSTNTRSRTQPQLQARDPSTLDPRVPRAGLFGVTSGCPLSQQGRASDRRETSAMPSRRGEPCT